MSSLTDRSEYRIKRIEWFELIGRIGVTAAGYPFEYVKVLIQIGHEPIPPKPVKTILGKPALALPGIWTYMKHIKRTDGFYGLYRGLFAKLCTNLISGFTHTIVLEKLNSLEVDDRSLSEEDMTEEQKLTKFVHTLIKETSARCAAILASHPLHVATVRTIAQFVGRESKYSGVFGSIVTIYREDGSSGYFSFQYIIPEGIECLQNIGGLVPRLIGEILTLWLASTVSFFINTYIVEEQTIKGYVKASMVYLASALLYPFVVVSNVVAVNNCGLSAGLPPNMPIYVNWTDCWTNLSKMVSAMEVLPTKFQGQLKRGSSILWRYYQGPYVTDRNSRPLFIERERFYSSEKKL